MEYADFSRGFVIKLSPQEEVHRSLIDFVDQKKIPSGFYSGIGALCDVELGYFSVEKKKYQRRTFSECYELISLNGNISTIKGHMTPHTHVALADENYQTLGGHLFSAIVTVTVELFLFPLDIALLRKPHPKFALNQLDLPHRFS